MAMRSFTAVIRIQASVEIACSEPATRPPSVTGRLRQDLTHLEFLSEPVVIGQRFGLLLCLDQRLAEIEVHSVALREIRIPLQERLEPIDRAGIPADAEVVVADVVLCLAQPVAR